MTASLIGVMVSLIGFAITILIVVTIHEYGHLLMARWCGVRVLRFSIGFGAPFWSWTSPRTQIEYALAPIPLGGYVQLFGQSDWPETDEAATPSEATGADGPDARRARAAGDPSSPPAQAERRAGAGETTEAERGGSATGKSSALPADAYPARPVPQRMLIAAGGPLFNFLLSAALLLLLAALGFGLSRPVLKPPVDGMLYSQGVRAGDTVVAVGDRPVRFVRDILTRSLAPIIEDGLVNLSVRSQSTGEIFQVSLRSANPNDSENFIEETFTREIGFLGPPAVIGHIDPDFPVARSPLRRGDRLVEIDGVAIGDFNDLVRAIGDRPHQILPVAVERDGSLQRFEVSTLATPDDARIGLLGVRLDTDHPDFAAWRQSLQIRPGFFDTFAIAAGELWDLFDLTFRSIAWLVTGALSIEHLKGPIGIATYAGSSLESGLLPFLHFIALVSVSIGVLNLLPIPVLDGGHIILLACEGVRGKPVPQLLELYLTWAGILFVGSIIVLTVFNDIYALL